MRIRMLAFLAIAVSCLAAPGSLLAQELPPGPAFPIQSKFEATAPGGAWDLVQLVLDFPPGAWTPRHSHGGAVFVTVLGGTITLRDDAGDHALTTGQSWSERPGEVHAAGNATGENVRVLVTAMLPEGAALTTAEDTGAASDLPSGPTLVYQTRTKGMPGVGAVEVFQLVGDFAAGAWTPAHEHGGRGVVTVLEGRFGVKDAAGERQFGPGESWIEGQGEIAAVGNPTAEPARVAASFVLPKGATLTTVREPAAVVPAGLPSTGLGGARHPTPVWVPTLASLAVAALGGAIAARRRGTVAAGVRRAADLR